MPKKRVSLHVYIDEEIDAALREMCAHHGDYAHIVREILRLFIEASKPNEIFVKKEV